MTNIKGMRILNITALSFLAIVLWSCSSSNEYFTPTVHELVDPVEAVTKVCELLDETDHISVWTEVSDDLEKLGIGKTISTLAKSGENNHLRGEVFPLDEGAPLLVVEYALFDGETFRRQSATQEDTYSLTEWTLTDSSTNIGTEFPDFEACPDLEGATITEVADSQTVPGTRHYRIEITDINGEELIDDFWIDRNGYPVRSVMKATAPGSEFPIEIERTYSDFGAPDLIPPLKLPEN